MKIPCLGLFRAVVVLAAAFGPTLHGQPADPKESPAPEHGDVPKPPAKASAAVVDDPALPRVLLIGDSISSGYLPFVRAALKGVANVHRIPENGAATIRGLQQLPSWLGTGHWDVIHFNWGLHDLKRDEKDAVQVTLADYESNLRKLVPQLQASGAKLVFATTTPVPGRTSNRHEEDVLAYNAAAVRVMQEFGVPVSDLHAIAQPRLQEIQLPKNVHYTPQGYEFLAATVTAAVRAQLPHK